VITLNNSLGFGHRFLGFFGLDLVAYHQQAQAGSVRTFSSTP
jgi:hypothetical protein